MIFPRMMKLAATSGVGAKIVTTNLYRILISRILERI